MSYDTEYFVGAREERSYLLWASCHVRTGLRGRVVRATTFYVAAISR